MGTALAIELIAEHSLKGILDDIMSGIGFEEGLYFFHELIIELVGIGLDGGVDGYSLIGDVGLTEFSGCDAAAVAVF